MIKLDNKGFAITTILFGTMILFLLLLVSLLGILSTYRKNLQKLMEHDAGSRDKITYYRQEVADESTIANDMNYVAGLYCFRNTGECRYVGTTRLNEIRGIKIPLIEE